ncbi:unnamed protein product [Rhizophagus irregularis]|nr:unnamed protein product [Rhizophagus irregularis]
MESTKTNKFLVRRPKKKCKEAFEINVEIIVVVVVAKVCISFIKFTWYARSLFVEGISFLFQFIEIIY